MSKDIKRTVKFFWLPDYEQEEEYLSNMHKNGWKLKNIIMRVYTFEKCEPENVTYRLDFSTAKKKDLRSYINMYKDYGWEYVQEMNDYSYFRKNSDGLSDDDLEIFSDNESQLEMIRQIIKTKLLPLVAIFICTIIQIAVRIFDREFNGRSLFLLVLWIIMFLTYSHALIRCYWGFKRLKKKYSKE